MTVSFDTACIASEVLEACNVMFNGSKELVSCIAIKKNSEPDVTIPGLIVVVILSCKSFDPSLVVVVLEDTLEINEAVVTGVSASSAKYEDFKGVSRPFSIKGVVTVCMFSRFGKDFSFVNVVKFVVVNVSTVLIKFSSMPNKFGRIVLVAIIIVVKLVTVDELEDVVK